MSQIFEDRLKTLTTFDSGKYRNAAVFVHDTLVTAAIIAESATGQTKESIPAEVIVAVYDRIIEHIENDQANKHEYAIA